MKHDIKSILKPSAQYTIPCAPGNSIEKNILTIVVRLTADSNLPTEIKTLINLMSDYGLRISELLNVKPTHIMSNGTLLIKGLKKSEDRLVLPTFGKEWLLKCKEGGVYPFNTFDRFFYYRLFKKYGLTYELNNGNKTAVTHAFRHVLLSSLHKQNVELNTLKKFIGHKSVKNTKHYASNQEE